RIHDGCGPAQDLSPLARQQAYPGITSLVRRLVSIVEIRLVRHANRRNLFAAVWVVILQMTIAPTLSPLPANQHLVEALVMLRLCPTIRSRNPCFAHSEAGRMLCAHGWHSLLLNPLAANTDLRRA